MKKYYTLFHSQTPNDLIKQYENRKQWTMPNRCCYV